MYNSSWSLATMKGLMMSDSLVVTRIIDYAARWHTEQVHTARLQQHSCMLSRAAIISW